MDFSECLHQGFTMLKQQTVLLLKVMLYEFIFEQSYTKASPLLQAQEIWACVTRPFLVGWLWAQD